LTFLCAHSPAFSTRAAAKSLQSGPTLCDPMDCSLPGSSVHGVSRQKYWSGLPCHLPDPGIEPVPLKSPVLVGRFFTSSATWDGTTSTTWHGSLPQRLLLLLLSHVSRVRLCATPWTAATRLLRPWDSPGKNTVVGCHFLLQCMIVKSESEVVQSCPTLRDPVDCSLPGSSTHGIFQARVLEWVTSAFSITQATW